MVFVQVRETYDLHTKKNKMTVIGIHTPKPNIIKRNFPGLLMQCKAYRPVSCDVRLACASVLPLDPKGVGLSENDVAPEDVFNPILYKAMSNFGMSQLESRINAIQSGDVDVSGDTAEVDVDDTTTVSDEFNIYYGLLSNAHGWKTAHPQQGLVMDKLKPFVWELLYNVGDSVNYGGSSAPNYAALDGDGTKDQIIPQSIRGNAKPFPFINCTSMLGANNYSPGFDISPANAEQEVPWMRVMCGAIIIPPSRLHELFFRMTVVWTLEFSQIRPLSEITDWTGLGQIGVATHFQNYSYESTKEAVTGSSDTILDQESAMVDSNVDVKKVM